RRSGLDAVERFGEHVPAFDDLPAEVIGDPSEQGALAGGDPLLEACQLRLDVLAILLRERLDGLLCGTAPSLDERVEVLGERTCLEEIARSDRVACSRWQRQSARVGREGALSRI